MTNNNRYYRKSTSITISTFYEQYQLKKYNLDPPYQRDKNVWDEKQQSFLIDTIFKNFPTPPIFLEQKINSETGITNYDVIDGKQRITTIVSFIEDKVCLPDTFGNDSYGNCKMNGKRFSEIKQLAKEDNEVKAYIAEFWAYSLSIEYIDNPDYKVVDNIFDRLNREGKRLNPQELRKAKYYDTILFNDIVELRNNEWLSKMLEKLNKNRLEDMSFITEIYLLALTSQIIDGNEIEIDSVFDEMVEKVTVEISNQIKQIIKEVIEIVRSFELDYDKYSISGVSHLYAIWYIGLYMYKNKIKVEENIIKKLQLFFEDLRGDKSISQVVQYQQSMQSASRLKYSRRKRVNALLDYLEFDII